MGALAAGTAAFAPNGPAWAVPAQTPLTEAPVLSVVSGHRSAISAISWSHDGSLLLSGSGDNTAKLWDVASGALIRTISAPQGYLRGLANALSGAGFLSQGQGIITSGSDGARLYDLQNGKYKLTIEESMEDMSALAISEQGSMVATAGNGPASAGARFFMHLRRSLDGAPVEIPHPDVYAIKSLAISPKGEWLLAGGSRVVKEPVGGGVETLGVAYLYSTIDGKRLQTYEGYPNEINWVAFANDGHEIYLKSSGTIKHLQSDTGKVIGEFIGWEAALSADGARIATSIDRTEKESDTAAVRIWSTQVKTPAILVPWPRPETDETRVYVTALAFNSAANHLAVGLSSGKLAVWDIAKSQYIQTWEARTSGPQHLQLVIAGGERLITARERYAAIWALHAGKPVAVLRGHNTAITSITASDDGARIATAIDTGKVYIWDGLTGAAQFQFHANQARVIAMAFTPNGKKLLTGGYNIVRVWNPDNGQLLSEIKRDFSQVTAIAFSAKADRLLVGDELGQLHLFSGHDFKWQRTIPAPDFNATVTDAAFDPKGQKMIVGYGNGYNRAIIYDLSTGRHTDLMPLGSWVESVQFDATGLRCATGSVDQSARVWDATTGKLIRKFEHRGDVVSVAFEAGGTQLVAYADESVYVWNLQDPNNETPLLQLVNLPQEGWAAVDASGRFDTSTVDDSRALYWFTSDARLHPLPFNILMRDYYEPRLWSRLSDCKVQSATDPKACDDAFAHLTPLKELNRVPPRVKIVAVKRGATDDVAVVYIEVGVGQDPSQSNGKTRTDVYDLKVFRNGQLVGQIPKPSNVPQTISHVADPAAWRSDRQVHMDGRSTQVLSIPARLDSRAAGQHVEFSAYALNEDRVKSVTDKNNDYVVPPNITPRAPRAYVITVGINAYENRDRNLNFAVNDAEALAAALGKIPGYKVVTVPLISDVVRPGDGRSRNIDQATKSNIRALIQMLSGRPRLPSELQGIAGVSDIRKARPEDLVIIAFAAHGDVEPSGRFYLLPSDSGRSNAITPATRKLFISADELAEWLEPLDAGEIALIIDACHSAGSIDVPGAKLGPMGDRGFGQLSYDKGIRILAATQADDFAVEPKDLKEGLLTFTLLKGLELRNETQRYADLDSNGAVTLAEWFRYAELSVPGVYIDVQHHRVPLIPRDPTFDINRAQNVMRRAQTPSFYDFAHAPDKVVIAEAPH